MSGTNTALDLIAIGRSSVDLYGEQIGGRLEEMGSFAKYIGGSPTNTAVALARLGLKAGLVTRIGADHMGRFIREQLAREGVEVRGVIEDCERLTALVILGIRDRNSFPLIFYRENCADMALCESDLDAPWLASARAVLLSGTHLSTPGVFATSMAAARIVKAAGGRVVFDIDYRPVLWGLTPKDLGENRFVADPAVTQRLQSVLPLCDLIVGTEEGNPHPRRRHRGNPRLEKHSWPQRRNHRAQAGRARLCGFVGAVPDSIDAGINAAGFRVEVFNVLGAGDAFMGGYLRGWLRTNRWRSAAAWRMPAGRLWYRGMAARRRCRRGRNYNTF